MKILKEEVVDEQSYYSLVDNYETALAQRDTRKPEKIKQKIIELINSTEEKRILLSHIVKTLEKEHLFSRGLIYKTLQTDKTFIKRPNSLGKIEVRLSKHSVLSTPDFSEKSRAANELINSGENNAVEFKSSLRWDYKLNGTNRVLEFEIAKAICAFLNSSGGNLFIGVDDSGKCLGLQNDLKTLGKKNRDGFQLRLVEIINQYLGKEVNKYISIQFIQLGDKDICWVQISQSNSPVFLKDNEKEYFFMRASASSQSLSIRESFEYIKSHWQ